MAWYNVVLVLRFCVPVVMCGVMSQELEECSAYRS